MVPNLSLTEERKKDKTRFLTLHSLVCKCCFIALLLNLLGKILLIDNDSGV